MSNMKDQMIRQMNEVHQPLDPECPMNPLENLFDDPMTIAYGCGDEIGDLLEITHRRSCERCQAYGLANIEVVPVQ